MAKMKDFDITKLSRSENVHTWKFTVENVMAIHGLTKAITPSMTAEITAFNGEERRVFTKCEIRPNSTILVLCWQHIRK